MKLELDLPDTALSALRQGPDEFGRSMRLMAAALWYQRGEISQERAAELAGQPRGEFLLSLSRLGIGPLQSVEEDLAWFQALP